MEEVSNTCDKDVQHLAKTRTRILQCYSIPTVSRTVTAGLLNWKHSETRQWLIHAVTYRLFTPHLELVYGNPVGVELLFLFGGFGSLGCDAVAGLVVRDVSSSYSKRLEAIPHRHSVPYQKTNGWRVYGG